MPARGSSTMSFARRVFANKPAFLPAVTLRPFGLVAAGLSVLAVPLPSLAQTSNDEARVRKLEAEVRALQRQVFPGGDNRFFEPEISGQTAQTGNAGGTSTTAVTDILTRLDALETQLQRLTATSEQNANTLQLLSARVETLEGPASAEAPAVRSIESAGTSAGTGVDTGTGAGTGEPAQLAPATQASTPPAVAASSPSAQRLEAVQAIAKPQSDDPADDEYSYGFRLWNAGFFPEAQQQLTSFVEQYPSHWRATYGRNLLGRAYLDDGKPREAAPWFLNNYQANKTAARAGDSLLYLAEAMIALEDTNRACIALAEFADTYPALATGRLQGKYESGLSKVSCN